MANPDKFTEQTAKRLAVFLSAPQRPEGTFSYCELAGFLFAVVCSPEPASVSEWLPQVFNTQGRGKGRANPAASIMGDILALYDFVNDGAMKGAPVLPPGCEAKMPTMQNFESDAPLSQWARGFAEGHDWLSDVWDAYAPTSVEEELGQDLLILTCFVSRDLAEEYLKEFQSQGETLEDFANRQLSALMQAMTSYARIGRTLSSQASLPVIADPPMTKRADKQKNDSLCRCGSGKKYRNCCGVTKH